MKFFYKTLLVIALLVCFAIARKTKTETKNTKTTKAKTDVAKAKRTKIDAVFECYIRLDLSASGNTEFTAKMKSSEILNPSGLPLGMYFDNLPTLSGPMAKALVKSGTRYYLPYRLITGNWNPVQTGLTSYDFIENTVNVEGTIHTFKLKVPYNTFSTNPVTYAELVDIANKLNTYRNTWNTSINNLKSTMNTEATNYKQNMDSATQAASGVTGLNAQLTTAQASQKTKEVLLASKVTEQAALEKSISDELTNYANAKSALETTLATIRSNDDRMKTIQDQITALNTQINSGSADSTSFQTAANNAKTLWDSTIKDLGTYTPEFKDPENLTKATTAFTNRKPDEVKSILAAVLP